MRAQRSASHSAVLGIVMLFGLAAPLFAQVSLSQSARNPNSPAQLLYPYYNFEQFWKATQSLPIN